MNWNHRVKVIGERSPSATLRRGVIGAAALLGVGLAVAACGTPADDPSSPIARIASGAILEDRSPAGSEADIDQFRDRGFCPQIIVPDGWNALVQQVRSSRRTDLAGQDPNAVVYQASINKVSRDCKTSGGTIIMTLGIAGRVTRGPAAEAIAAVDLPLTVEIYDRLADTNQSLSVKLHEHKVAFTPGQPTSLWAIVLSGVSAPSGSQGIEIRVGFAPQAARRQ